MMHHHISSKTIRNIKVRFAILILLLKCQNCSYFRVSNRRAGRSEWGGGGGGWQVWESGLVC